jgi:phosphatidylinositol alpha-1,6-mannosyltransferase
VADNSFKAKGVKIIRTSYSPRSLSFQYSFSWFSSLLKFILFTLKTIVIHKPDYVVVGQSLPFLILPAYIIQIVLHKPYILFSIGEEIPQIQLKSMALQRYVYFHALSFFYISNYTRDRLEAFMGKERTERITFTKITPGVEDVFFEKVNQDEISNLKKKLNIENKHVLTSIARLDERKGHDKLVEALPLVLSKFPDTVLLIGGAGDRLEYIKKLVKEKSLENNVIFLGLVPFNKLVAYHNLGDIYVLPNRTLEDGDTEGFGIVFLEANACGKPVIGGRAGGVVEAVVDGVTGLLVTPEDPKDIAEKICRLLGDKKLAEEMGQKGRERAWNEYRWGYLSGKFENAILALSERKGKV